MWAARDYDGMLCLYEKKPTLKADYLGGGRYESHSGGYAEMGFPKEAFPQITYENSPQEVLLLTGSQLDEMLDEARAEGFMKGQMSIRKPIQP